MLLINKPIGLTPLEVINQLKVKKLELRDKKISYAGRLDPMAEGLLMLLIDDENKKRQKFENLAKTYDFDVVFGIATDSYDQLGLITKSSSPLTKKGLKKKLSEIIPRFIGKQQHAFPPFSSKPVNGKPLYYWARENKLSEITIPTKEIEIFDFKLVSVELITTNDLRLLVTTNINLVQGTFRQEEIKTSWSDFFAATSMNSFPRARLTLTCSSGTYVRGIAHELGKKLSSGAFCTRILRTRIGTHSLKGVDELYK